MDAISLFLTIFLAVTLAEISATLLTALYVTWSAKRKFARQQAYFASLESRLTAEADVDASEAAE